MLQIRERRIPGSEIVHMQLYAERANCREGGGKLVGVVHQHLFGDLELEVLSGETRSSQRASDMVCEVWLGKTVR